MKSREIQRNIDNFHDFREIPRNIDKFHDFRVFGATRCYPVLPGVGRDYPVYARVYPVSVSVSDPVVYPVSVSVSDPVWCTRCITVVTQWCTGVVQ